MLHMKRESESEPPDVTRPSPFQRLQESSSRCAQVDLSIFGPYFTNTNVPVFDFLNTFPALGFGLGRPNPKKL